MAFLAGLSRPGVRFRGRYWGQSGHELVRCIRLLLTQSGHPLPPHTRELLRSRFQASAAAMRRREFIAVVGGAAVAYPLMARAQQSAMPVIGFINAAPAQGYEGQLTAFLKGLDEKGYADGRNVTIEYRWAEGHNDRLASMATDLVRRQVT